MIMTAMNIVIAFTLLVFAAFATLVMLHVFGGGVTEGGRERAAKVHRRLGWAFVACYAALLILMLTKMLEYGKVDTLAGLHIGIALSVIPMLMVKILIVRKYKPLYKYLPALGIFIFAGVFTIVGLGVAGHLRPQPEATGGSAAEFAGELDGDTSRRLVRRLCSTCHGLDRIYMEKGQRPPKWWVQTVDRMLGYDDELTVHRDAILSYLKTELSTPEGIETDAREGAKLLSTRCTFCHDLERVFKAVKTPDEWRSTILRYGQLIPDNLQEGDVEPLVLFLSERRLAGE